METNFDLELKLKLIEELNVKSDLKKRVIEESNIRFNLKQKIIEELNRVFLQEMNSDSVSLQKIDEIMNYMYKKYADKFREFNYKNIVDCELDIKLIVSDVFVNSILKEYLINDNVSSIYFHTGIPFLPLDMNVEYYKRKSTCNNKYFFSYLNLLNAINGFIGKCATEIEPTINKKIMILRSILN